MSKQKNLVKITLEIKVTTQASTTRFKQKAFPKLEIALHAIPEKGKANGELINFLSKELKVPKSQIEIIRGLTSKTKIVVLIIPQEEESELILKLQGS